MLLNLHLILMWLCSTASRSKGEIIPVQKALGDKCEEIELFLDNSGGGSNRLHSTHKSTNERRAIESHALPLVKVSTIDQFVSENQIRKVDFIKADIEGAERYMLTGATDTLRRFAPKLAICTYHLKDDPQVLEDIRLYTHVINYLLPLSDKRRASFFDIL